MRVPKDRRRKELRRHRFQVRFQPVGISLGSPAGFALDSLEALAGFPAIGPASLPLASFPGVRTVGKRAERQGSGPSGRVAAGLGASGRQGSEPNGREAGFAAGKWGGGRQRSKPTGREASPLAGKRGLRQGSGAVGGVRTAGKQAQWQGSKPNGRKAGGRRGVRKPTAVASPTPSRSAPILWNPHRSRPHTDAESRHTRRREGVGDAAKPTEASGHDGKRSVRGQADRSVRPRREAVGTRPSGPKRPGFSPATTGTGARPTQPKRPGSSPATTGRGR